MPLSFNLTQAMAQTTKNGPSHAISMHGTPELGSDYKHFQFANPDAPKGGAFNFGVVGTFDSLNPFILNSMRTTARGMWDAQLGHTVFESLMYRNRDEPFSLYGLLAEKVEMPDDRSWIEFTLNPLAKWSDGMPVVADDVIFTFELLTEKGRPPYSSRSKRFEKIEKTGERKVKITFNEKSNREYPLIVAGFTPILPKHATKTEGFENSTLTPLLGSGPYKVKEVDAGRKITYARDSNYWGANLPVRAGFNNFDEISIEYFQQSSVMFEAFKKGLIDVVSESQPAKWERDYNFPAVTDGKVIKKTFTSGAPSNMQAFIFNTRKDIFKDKNVREALSNVFDFESINKNLFFGVFKRTHSFWQGSHLSAFGQPASDFEKELLAPYPQSVSQSVMNGTWRPTKTRGNGPDRKVIRAALKQLLDAGFKREGNALLGPDGKPFTFEIMTKNANEEKLALAYKDNLAKIGIDISIRLVDDAQFQGRVKEYEYDMIIGAYSASLSPGAEQTWRWGTKSTDVPGTFNFAGANDTAIDAVIEAIVQARETDEFTSAVRAMDRVLISGHYVIPTYHLGKQWVAHWQHLDHPSKTPLYGVRYPVWWHNGK
ncbi:MAG: extracellular solute-binding protein [Nitratireductor sp.]